jgi:hypothetical protein
MNCVCSEAGTNKISSQEVRIIHRGAHIPTLRCIGALDGTSSTLCYRTAGNIWLYAVSAWVLAPTRSFHRKFILLLRKPHLNSQTHCGTGRYLKVSSATISHQRDFLGHGESAATAANVTPTAANLAAVLSRHTTTHQAAARMGSEIYGSRYVSSHACHCPGNKISISLTTLVTEDIARLVKHRDTVKPRMFRKFRAC